ncbi:MAG: tetratricopeptide repeat protein [Planctomycetes bacterium]|nr:tetratricopeptide repeat protein [Planctomycetota bacterium]
MLKQILKTQPNHTEALKKLADAYAGSNRRDQAVATLRQLFKAQPQDVDTGNQLAWLLATSPVKEVRNGEEAVRVSEAVCKLTNRDNPAHLDTLAVALAEAGRFEDAVRTAEEALALADKKNDSEVASEVRTHLEIFKRRTPFHEPAP